ncbi:MAG: hypothetical protein IMF08_10830 [Proteobacteria bacterium]|nr:hypothetical protein [Pseudomonadota bacterium]
MDRSARSLVRLDPLVDGAEGRRSVGVEYLDPHPIAKARDGVVLAVGMKG